MICASMARVGCELLLGCNEGGRVADTRDASINYLTLHLFISFTSSSTEAFDDILRACCTNLALRAALRSAPSIEGAAP